MAAAKVKVRELFSEITKGEARQNNEIKKHGAAYRRGGTASPSEMEYLSARNDAILNSAFALLVKAINTRRY